MDRLTGAHMGSSCFSADYGAKTLIRGYNSLKFEE